MTRGRMCALAVRYTIFVSGQIKCAIQLRAPCLYSLVVEILSSAGPRVKYAIVLGRINRHLKVREITSLRCNTFTTEMVILVISPRIETPLNRRYLTHQGRVGTVIMRSTWIVILLACYLVAPEFRIRPRFTESTTKCTQTGVTRRFNRTMSHALSFTRYFSDNRFMVQPLFVTSVLCLLITSCSFVGKAKASQKNMTVLC